MAPILMTLWRWRKGLILGTFVLILGLFLWRVSAWHDAYERLGSVEDALEAERLCGEGSTCAARQAALEAAHVETNARVVETYEQELDDLRNRPIPVRTVRLCPAGSGVQGASAPGTPDGTGPGADVVSAETGRDIGPDLYQLAREADEVAARLRALQEWNAALAR
jgi:hypothetical protein